EGPYTDTNYLLEEMGFSTARKHAEKLRRHAQILAFALPLVLTGCSVLLDGGAATLAATLAAVSTTGGLLTEHRLFFRRGKTCGDALLRERFSLSVIDSQMIFCSRY
ncbi:MAG: hypothetical protein R3174_00005, partial [Gammaproteobacteria bacterium]|nr:hypothetical protein [Gammaproteobacteria bacterium]